MYKKLKFRKAVSYERELARQTITGGVVHFKVIVILIWFSISITMIFLHHQESISGLKLSIEQFCMFFSCPLSLCYLYHTSTKESSGSLYNDIFYLVGGGSQPEDRYDLLFSLYCFVNIFYVKPWALMSTTTEKGSFSLCSPKK